MRSERRKLLASVLLAISIVLVAIHAGSEKRLTSVSAKPAEGIATTESVRRCTKKELPEHETEPRKYVETPITETELHEMDEMAELELLACCTFAEAGNQGYTGMRKVAAVVLNRVNSDQFPDTITEVITQKNQFECVSNGSIYRLGPSEECFDAVRDELKERSDTDILFFRTGHYSDYGTPAYKYGDHYFSY